MDDLHVCEDRLFSFPFLVMSFHDKAKDSSNIRHSLTSPGCISMFRSLVQIAFNVSKYSNFLVFCKVGEGVILLCVVYSDISNFSFPYSDCYAFHILLIYSISHLALSVGGWFPRCSNRTNWLYLHFFPSNWSSLGETFFGSTGRKVEILVRWNGTIAK